MDGLQNYIDKKLPKTMVNGAKGNGIKLGRGNTKFFELFKRRAFLPGFFKLQLEEFNCRKNLETELEPMISRPTKPCRTIS
jgi:hypothetical protein